MSTERYPKKLAAELHHFGSLTKLVRPTFSVLSSCRAFTATAGGSVFLRTQKRTRGSSYFFKKEKAILDPRPVFVSGSVPRWFR